MRMPDEDLPRPFFCLHSLLPAIVAEFSRETSFKEAGERIEEAGEGFKGEHGFQRFRTEAQIEFIDLEIIFALGTEGDDSAVAGKLSGDEFVFFEGKEAVDVRDAAEVVHGPDAAEVFERFPEERDAPEIVAGDSHFALSGEFEFPVVSGGESCVETSGEGASALFFRFLPAVIFLRFLSFCGGGCCFCGGGGGDD